VFVAGEGVHFRRGRASQERAFVAGGRRVFITGGRRASIARGRRPFVAGGEEAAHHRREEAFRQLMNCTSCRRGGKEELGKNEKFSH
jgi:hypothetical protein